MSRRAGWLLTVGLFPAVFAGAVLTIWIFGAYFGVPLLGLVGRPWWKAQRAARGRPVRPAVVAVTLALAVACWAGTIELLRSPTPPPAT